MFANTTFECVFTLGQEKKVAPYGKREGAPKIARGALKQSSKIMRECGMWFEAKRAKNSEAYRERFE